MAAGGWVEASRRRRARSAIESRDRHRKLVFFIELAADTPVPPPQLERTIYSFRVKRPPALSKSLGVIYGLDAHFARDVPAGGQEIALVLGHGPPSRL
jgi:hypothetical protein